MVQYTLTLDSFDAYQRLDKTIASALSNQHAVDISRNQIQNIISNGDVQVDGNVIQSAKYKTQDGQQIVITVPDKPDEVTAYDIELDIVYEDEYLAIVNKPAGLVTHLGSGNNKHTLVNALVAKYGDNLSDIGEFGRNGIVHRLDKDTSGLLIIAKDNDTHIKLAAMIKKRHVSRIYLALVCGLPNPAVGSIDTLYGRHPVHRTKMAVLDLQDEDLKTEKLKSAVTHYKTLKHYHDLSASLVEFKLETGRTHQIRVHASYAGFPVVGDQTYMVKRFYNALPDRLKSFKRQALHAHKLDFIHPFTGQQLQFKAEMPKDMADLAKL